MNYLDFSLIMACVGLGGLAYKTMSGDQERVQQRIKNIFLAVMALEVWALAPRLEACGEDTRVSSDVNSHSLTQPQSVNLCNVTRDYSELSQFQVDGRDLRSSDFAPFGQEMSRTKWMAEFYRLNQKVFIPSLSIPPQIADFMTEYAKEIEIFYEAKSLEFVVRLYPNPNESFPEQPAQTDWKCMGSGISKETYSIPVLPDYVMKIPHLMQRQICAEASSSVLTPAEQEDIRIMCSEWRDKFVQQFENMQNAKTIQKKHNYKKIVIPESYFIDMKFGPILFESKLHTTEYAQFITEANRTLMISAIEEFGQFLSKADLCDISIFGDHNAMFLKNSETDPHIGIFDVDTRCARPFS